MAEIPNVYQDDRRAAAYAALEFAGTYHLAFRDLPALIAKYVRGRRAVDFGCGTGRSTRFLKELGFETIGIDIAPEMIERARKNDPRGDYRLLDADGLARMPEGLCDLILCAFPFDNIAPRELKIRLLGQLRRLLGQDGRLINVVSSPEIYTHEWASFSTKDFPENHHAQSGDPVRIITTVIEDSRPCVDILCTDEEYRAIYESAGLAILETCKPLARGDEPEKWVSETRIAPWVIYVLGRR
ncbi:MAG TPA: class I SAM-dependent methyltransferase [Polyangia bacterium]|jgi:SAM-dependent methyltransferase|nr:class I SAM-dependent methyltransferase [Polyangia bacterium]